MEGGVVVETLAGEGDEIVHGVGRVIVGELGLDDALVGGDLGDLGEFDVGGDGAELLEGDFFLVGGHGLDFGFVEFWYGG